jgi:hypothetical protein
MNGNLDNLLKAIAHSPDRAWLKQCRDHNAKLGGRNEATEQRLRYLDLLDALKMRLGAHTLEERILESVQVYRALLKRKHGRDQAAAYIEREIKQHGPREALIRTIR